MNELTQLEFEITYHDIAVQYVNHNIFGSLHNMYTLISKVN